MTQAIDTIIYVQNKYIRGTQFGAWKKIGQPQKSMRDQSVCQFSEAGIHALFAEETVSQ